MDEYVFNYSKMTEHENVLKLKSNISIDLINHYEQVKNDIYLDMRLKLTDFDSYDESLNHELVKWDKQISAKLNKSLEFNILELNQFFSKYCKNLSENKEDVKLHFIKSFCFYLKYDSLSMNFKPRNGVGLVVFTDWYLDENQTNYLKILFGGKNEQTKHIKINYDQNILMLNYATFDVLNNETLYKKLDNELVLNKSEIEPKLLQRDLISIELEGEHLKTLKKDTFIAFKHLIQLSLHDFKFASVEELAFEGPKNLKILTIDTQPPYMRNFEFDLFGSEEKLNATIIKPIQILHNLNELHLHNFIWMETFFKSFQQLTILDLSYCEIGRLKYDFFDGLASLRELDLKFCKIFEIDNFTFCDLVKLEILNLHSNKINDLNEKTFSGLGNLKELDLSFNDLLDVKEGTFKMMPQLESLDLSNSLISNLDENTFDGLKNLKRLNLNNTHYLKTASLNTFEKLKSLQSLNLDSCSIETYLKELFNGLKIH